MNIIKQPNSTGRTLKRWIGASSVLAAMTLASTSVFADHDGYDNCDVERHVHHHYYGNNHQRSNYHHPRRHRQHQVHNHYYGGGGFFGGTV